MTILRINEGANSESRELMNAVGYEIQIHLLRSYFENTTARAGTIACH